MKGFEFLVIKNEESYERSELIHSKLITKNSKLSRVTGSMAE
jgi:hypothetical protein